MKLPGLIDLSLILILASTAKGQDWIVHIPYKNINVTSGKDVFIPCNLSYPSHYRTSEVKVYWKKQGVPSIFDTKDADKYAFIYHHNNTFVLEKYRNRTMLLGNKTAGNCSLLIKNVTENEQNMYVRVIEKSEKYSFVNNTVSISVSGVKQSTQGVITKKVPQDKPQYGTPITVTNFNFLGTMVDFTTPLPTSVTSTTNYMAIFVPVAALLIIIVIVGIVFCIKNKRSKSFTRQDSGYYANFRRPSAHQANSEAHSKNQDKDIPEPKAIDEPVYINMETPSDQMDQSTDHTDGVYANVDYSKE